MSKFLDARTSQNASFAESIAIALTKNTPELVGQIGLDVTGAGPLLRVQMTGTVTVQHMEDDGIWINHPTVTVTIVRGTLPTDHLVYSATQTLNYERGPQVLTVTASDYNVPVPTSGLLVYTMFVSTNEMGVTRVGPESFNGAAYSD